MTGRLSRSNGREPLDMTLSGAARVAVALSAAALACVGCSSHTDNAGPAMTTTTAAAPLFDTCSLPDALLQQAGLDAGTKRRMTQFTGETSCTWKNADYGVIVIADRTMTMEYIRNKYGNRDFTGVTVSGRPGLQYHDSGENPPTGCNLAFTVKTGGVVALLETNANFDVTHVAPACERVQQVAVALMPGLPVG